MESKAFKFLVLAGLLLSASSMTQTAAEKNSADIDDKTSAVSHATQELINSRNLMEAARTGNLEAVRTIMEGSSRSWSIAFFSHLGILSYLEDLTAIYNQSDKEDTPLFVAIENGHVDVARYFIQLLDIDINDDLNYYGITSLKHLMYAAFNNDAESVKNLLAIDADVNRVSRSIYSGYSETPLIIATKQGHSEIVRILLDANASPDTVESTNNRSPLFAAALKGHTEIAQMLIDAGASLNTADEATRSTPLFVAALNEHTETVQVLLAAGASPNLNNNKGETPLYGAATKGHTEIVQILLDTGASPDALDENGFSPLFRAAGNGHKKVIQALLAAGASPTIASKKGRTCLSRATKEGHLEIVPILIDACRNRLITQRPTFAHIKARTPSSSLESMPLEVGQLIAEWLEIQDILNLRETSTNCRAYAGHEFEKNIQKSAREELIKFIRSTEKYRGFHFKKKIASLLKLELEKAEQFDVLNPPISCALLGDSSINDEGVAGPLTATVCAVAQQQNAVMPMGCAIAQQHTDEQASAPYAQEGVVAVAGYAPTSKDESPEEELTLAELRARRIAALDQGDGINNGKGKNEDDTKKNK